MSFFKAKVTCVGCGQTVGLNRFKTPHGWLCPTCFKNPEKTDLPAPPQKDSKHVNEFKNTHIQSGESVVSWCEGYIGEMMGKGDKTQRNGVLIVTESRVVFYRKGTFGEILETMPLSKITSIERKTTMGHKTLRLHTSHDDLEFKFFDKFQETKLIDAIEAGRESTSAQSPASGESTSPMDALKKLAELKEIGVISEDEFTAKKAELLDKI